jgi:GNAT superfamily N-acetyltransferase
MNLWESYYSERYGANTVSTEHGFIVYLINAPVCIVWEIFIVKEKRQSGLGKMLVNQVETLAKLDGCTRLLAQIEVFSATANEALLGAMHVGFRLQELEGNRIILAKQL